MADIKVEMSTMFAAWVKALPTKAIEAAARAMDSVGLVLLERIPAYPPKPAPGVVVSRMTPRQRGWWFAQGVKGYKGRTANLGRLITFEVKTTDKTAEGVLGTTSKYAPWVIGKKFPGETIEGEQMWQANCMQHWWRFDEVVGAGIPEAQATFAREFNQEFEEKIKHA